VRADPTIVRIRAIIRAAVANPAVKASTISAALLVPYIRIRTTLGQFFKFVSPSDSVSISDGQNYFAEDYVEPGYVAVPFYINFTKVLTEAVALVDNIVLTRFRTPTDSSTVSESSALLVGKTPSEALSLSDTATRDYTKAVSELATLADAAARSVSKPFSESLTSGDDTTINLTKPRSDSTTIADSSALDFRTSRTEALSLTDAATTAFTKGLSEAPSLTDVVALSASLAIIEQPVASDSGNLRMQDYCAFDYFAEDYVGASRTFT